MVAPKVSVIIPTYNQAHYLGAAVEGILAQTFTDFELIVVNDASTDHTTDVMRQFDDPRIRYIVHSENRYAATARNTGIRAATGELIAFLDADDLVHPEKLQTQVAFLDQYPDVGLTYCSRLEVDETGQPCSIIQAPPKVTLADLVLGYPFAPSEVVMRKGWAIQVGLFDETFLHSGEDPDFHLRLALAGCPMARVGRFLNYRRLHVRRVYWNLAEVAAAQLRAFENAFVDPRCPPTVRALRKRSLGMLHMVLAYDAFQQEETAMGQSWLRTAIRFDPSIIMPDVTPLRDYLIRASVRDGGDHAELLDLVFAQLPPELAPLAEQREWAIARGYLMRGMRDILWGRLEQGQFCVARATELGAQIDESLQQALLHQLLNFETVYGTDAAQAVARTLLPALEPAAGRKTIRRLRGQLAVNQAFRAYRSGQYMDVIPHALRALFYEPPYLINRGVVAILARSILAATGVKLLQS